MFTSARLHLCSSSHLHAHLHICASTSPLIFTSSHLHLTSSPLHIHILTYISAHVHICACTSLLILTSADLHLRSSAHPHIYISHLHLSLFFTFSLKAGGGAAGAPRNATLCGDRARRTQARVRFVSVRRNPLRRSCVSRARNAGESALWIGRGQPSAEIVRVEGAKCRRECVLGRSGAKSSVSRARNADEIAFWIWPGQASAEIVRVEGVKCRCFGPVRRPRLQSVSRARNAAEIVRVEGA